MKVKITDSPYSDVPNGSIVEVLQILKNWFGAPSDAHRRQTLDLYIVDGVPHCLFGSWEVELVREDK
jgi:hypothetical protein